MMKKMTKVIRLIIIPIFVFFISTSADAFTWKCSNIEGMGFSYEEGNFVQNKDGFFGLIIEITKNKGDSSSIGDSVTSGRYMGSSTVSCPSCRRP